MFKVNAITPAHNGFSELFYAPPGNELFELLDLLRTLDHRNR